MKYNDCVILSGTKWSRRIQSCVVLFALFIISACTDIGDRDNPLDPGADNYVSRVDEPGAISSSCSSSEKDPDLVEVSSSSNKVPEPADGPSSSQISAVSSSSKVPVLSSAEQSPASSSSEESNPSSSSKVPEPVEGSSSDTELFPASSSDVEQPPVSFGNTEPPQESSSSDSDWTCGVSNVVRGDREYRTVVIKEQCWMQENLRYVPSVGNTMCYDGEESNCEKYGLLYDYEAASIACPTGWRLPTSAEYESLAEYSMEGAPLYDAGAHFKATSGWTPENGDDFLEFTALPGGSCDDAQNCLNVGKMGYWWTSTEKVKNTSHLSLALNGDGDSYSAENKMDNDRYISVRCVKK